MKGLFDCDDVGELKEYVGCKLELDWDKRQIKVTQPVLLQSYQDKQNCTIPAEPGKVLIKAKAEEGAHLEQQTK